MSRMGVVVMVVMCAGVGAGGALDVRVNGDVLFALHLSERAQHRLARAQPPASAPPSPPAPTAAPPCRFHFPEQEQVEAILSNMMNELTKVFVRANLFLKSDEEHTRHSGVWRAEEGEGGSSTSTPLGAPSRGAPATVSSPVSSTSPSAQVTTPAARTNRFKVVHSKNTQFFEHIFHNMTEEFSSVYNESEHVSRARRDPCRQQGAVRRAWRDLLRRSLAAFRRAALNCVQDYLKIQECEERTKARLVRFLVRELGKMRARHLQLLCDRFQLCLDEGLLA